MSIFDFSLNNYWMGFSWNPIQAFMPPSRWMTFLSNNFSDSSILLRCHDQIKMKSSAIFYGQFMTNNLQNWRHFYELCLMLYSKFSMLTRLSYTVNMQDISPARHQYVSTVITSILTWHCTLLYCVRDNITKQCLERRAMT